MSVVFPPLSYLPFLTLLYFFSSLGVILGPLRVVKSKCIWVIKLDMYYLDIYKQDTGRCTVICRIVFRVLNSNLECDYNR